jgi:hypothetical protein
MRYSRLIAKHRSRLIAKLVKSLKHFFTLHARRIRQVGLLICLDPCQVSSSRSNRVNNLARKTRIHYARAKITMNVRGLVDYGRKPRRKRGLRAANVKKWLHTRLFIRWPRFIDNESSWRDLRVRNYDVPMIYRSIDRHRFVSVLLTNNWFFVSCRVTFVN